MSNFDEDWIQTQALYDLLDAQAEVLAVLKDDQDGPVSELRQMHDLLKRSLAETLEKAESLGVDTDFVPLRWMMESFRLLGSLQFRRYLQNRDGN